MPLIEGERTWPPRSPCDGLLTGLPRWATTARQAARGANAGGWSATGFISPKELISDFKSATDSGKITGCIMHPLMHPFQKPNKKRVRRSLRNSQKVKHFLYEFRKLTHPLHSLHPLDAPARAIVPCIKVGVQSQNPRSKGLGCFLNGVVK